MTLCKKFSFLIIISLIGLSCVSIGNCYEDTEYLPYGESTYYGVEMLVGDNLTWSFNTYSEEFVVQCRLDADIYLSEGLTSDSGVWYAPDNDTYYIIFINWDVLLFRNGWININFEVNVEPEPDPDPTPTPEIPSFYPLIIIGIIGCISAISAIVIKKKMGKSL